MIWIVIREGEGYDGKPTSDVLPVAFTNKRRALKEVPDYFDLQKVDNDSFEAYNDNKRVYRILGLPLNDNDTE